MLRKRAFTLIELLVVVAIISLLIAILLPALQRVREKGKATVCMSNMRSLGIALQTYMYTNRDYFPSVGFMHGGESNPGQSWVTLMADEYVRDGGDVEYNGADATLREEVDDVRRCPSDRSPHYKQPRNVGDGNVIWRQTSYASNYYLAVEDARAVGKEDPTPFNRIDRIRYPASTAYWLELAETGEYATADHVHPELWFAGNPENLAAEQMAIKRHDDRANYAMVDGHVESLPFEKTYRIDYAGSDIFAGRIAWFYNKYDPEVGK